MASERFKVVTFTDPQEFLAAVDMKKNDSSFLNFALGSIMDSLDERHMALRGPASRTLLGVYEGEELVVILTRVKGDFAWMIHSLRDVWTMDETFVLETTYLLSRYLMTIIEPQTFDLVFGHDALAEAFQHAYVAELNFRGIAAKTPPPIFRSQVSYATKATLPPPSSAFFQHPVRLARSPEDLDVLAEMYYGFLNRIGHKTPIEACKKEMNVWLSLGLTWFCYVDNEPAGYVAIGRSTPRTIAIRNVYVKPEFRRRGVAETLVRALTRYYLGAEPLGLEGAPEGPPKEGTKEEIGLNVIEEHIARLYRRCGFLLGDEDRDPSTGKKGWVHSSFWPVEYPKE